VGVLLEEPSTILWNGDLCLPNAGLRPNLFHPIHHCTFVGRRKMGVTLSHSDGLMPQNIFKRV